MDCVFCKIASKELPAEIAYEDGEVMAFKDTHPSAPIHELVIPKTHIQSIAHLEENHEHIISKMIYTAKNLAEQFGLRGYKIMFNVGREGGQMVDHLHLHLLGGWQSGSSEGSGIPQ